MRSGVVALLKRRAVETCIAALAIGLLSGCMSSSDEMAAGGGSAGVSSAGGATSSQSWAQRIVTGGRTPIDVDPDAFAADIYCPRIELLPGTHLIQVYNKRNDPNPTNLQYQAAVDEWARSCRREGVDQTRIKIGVSGNVTPGPAWPGGEVKLPLRVAIVTGEPGDEPISSQIVSIPVNIGAGAAAQPWTFIDENFVVPRDRVMKIVVGFDDQKRR
ncbi:MAG: hypothetical protein HWE23_16480 [Rhodobacteraceae bacterium]|nr:hypothetical protein [Paracoccaceae bacterium]